jgi:hypothetical protein
MAIRQQKTTMIKTMMDRMAFIPGPVIGIRFLLLSVGWIGIARSPYIITFIINHEKKEHPSESFFKALKASADPGDPVGEAVFTLSFHSFPVLKKRQPFCAYPDLFTKCYQKR